MDKTGNTQHIDEFTKDCLKVHGFNFSESESEDEHGDFDERYFSLKPPPVPYGDMKDRVVTLGGADIAPFDEVKPKHNADFDRIVANLRNVTIDVQNFDDAAKKSETNGERERQERTGLDADVKVPISYAMAAKSRPTIDQVTVKDEGAKKRPTQTPTKSPARLQQELIET